MLWHTQEPVVAWHIAPVSTVTRGSHSRFSSCTTDAQEMCETGAETWISTLKADDIVGTSGVLYSTCLVMS
jgi:hypothetical protein